MPKKKKTNYLLLSCEDVKQVSSANTNIIFWLWRWLPHRSSKRQSLESLSKGVFERRTSTGSEAFSLLTCLDDIKFVFLSFFTVIEAIWLKIWAKTPSKDEKRPLPVDVRRSKTLLLKLPNVESHEKLWIDVFSVVFDVGGGGWACVVYKRATNEIFPPDFCPRLYRSRSIDFRCFWNSAVELLL